MSTGPVDAMVSRWRRRALMLRGQAKRLPFSDARAALVRQAREREACVVELEDLLKTVREEA